MSRRRDAMAMDIAAVSNFQAAPVHAAGRPPNFITVVLPKQDRGESNLRECYENAPAGLSFVLPASLRLTGVGRYQSGPPSEGPHSNTPAVVRDTVADSV